MFSKAARYTSIDRQQLYFYMLTKNNQKSKFCLKNTIYMSTGYCIELLLNHCPGQCILTVHCLERNCHLPSTIHLPKYWKILWKDSDWLGWYAQPYGQEGRLPRLAASTRTIFLDYFPKGRRVLCKATNVPQSTSFFSLNTQ